MDDYRDVEGIKVAHHIVQKVEGQVLSDSRVTQVILNAEEGDNSSKNTSTFEKLTRPNMRQTVQLL